MAAADDAATANWGNSWQMPTVEQLKELLENCTTTMPAYRTVITPEYKEEVVSGIELTSNINGNRIFLPNALDSQQVSAKEKNLAYDVIGHYWTSMLSDNIDNASNLYFKYRPSWMGNLQLKVISYPDNSEEETPRYFGLSIRPVFK